MDRLSTTIINHFRSFLSTKEIYRSSGVCKSWQDVTDIPKAIYIRPGFGTFRPAEIPPPSSVVLTKVYTLDIEFFHGEWDLVLDTLNRCAPTVRNLEIYCYSDSPTTRPLPHFPKVTNLSLYLHPDTMSLNSFLSKTPCLTHFRLDGPSAHHTHDQIDFSLIPQLQKLELCAGVNKFLNMSDVNLAEIDFHRLFVQDENLLLAQEFQNAYPKARILVYLTIGEDNFEERINQVQSNPAFIYVLNFGRFTSGSEGMTIMCKMRFNSSEAIFVKVRIGDERQGVARIRPFIEKIKSISQSVRISRKMTNKNEFLILLIKTNEFSMEEIGEICLHMVD